MSWKIAGCVKDSCGWERVDPEKGAYPILMGRDEALDVAEKLANLLDEAVQKWPPGYVGTGHVVLRAREELDKLRVEPKRLKIERTTWWASNEDIVNKMNEVIDAVNKLGA